MEELMTLPEVAEYLNVKQKTVYDYARKGFLKSANLETRRRGYVLMFRKDAVDQIKNQPAWSQSDYKTSQGRSLYRKRVQRPEKDEAGINGCTIHWTERLRLNNYTFVPISCGVCGKKQNMHEQHLLANTKKGTFTGCCPGCYSRRRKQPLPSNGRIERDEYIFRHIRTFTEDEQKIVSGMRLNNGLYISEHRAIAAITLGRPLCDDESVHHVNGIKTDNTPENLLVYQPHEHTKAHMKQYNRILKLEKELEQLKKENELLKNRTSEIVTLHHTTP